MSIFLYDFFLMSEQLWINKYFVPHMKYKSMVQKRLDQARVLRTEYITQVQYLIFSFSVHGIPSTIASSADIIGWGCIVNDECFCLAFKIWKTCKGSIVRFCWYFTVFLICRFSCYELLSCGALVDISKWLDTCTQYALRCISTMRNYDHCWCYY